MVESAPTTLTNSMLTSDGMSQFEVPMPSEGTQDGSGDVVRANSIWQIGSREEVTVGRNRKSQASMPESDVPFTILGNASTVQLVSSAARPHITRGSKTAEKLLRVYNQRRGWRVARCVAHGQDVCKLARRGALRPGRLAPGRGKLNDAMSAPGGEQVGCSR